MYSTVYACPNCNISFEELEPRTFSFNSPYGACPECDGLGTREEFDPELVLPSTDMSLADGAIAPWKGLSTAAAKKLQAELDKFLRRQQGHLGDADRGVLRSRQCIICSTVKLDRSFWERC